MLTLNSPTYELKKHGWETTNQPNATTTYSHRVEWFPLKWRRRGHLLPICSSDTVSDELMLTGRLYWLDAMLGFLDEETSDIRLKPRSTTNWIETGSLPGFSKSGDRAYLDALELIYRVSLLCRNHLKVGIGMPIRVGKMPCIRQDRSTTWLVWNCAWM